MSLLERLARVWADAEHPFFIKGPRSIHFEDVLSQRQLDLTTIRPGDVVALVGDFDPLSICTFLNLVDRGAIIVPLAKETHSQHEYFLDQPGVDVVIEGASKTRRDGGRKHPLVTRLADQGHAGLVLYSTGTTGRPKAILHDLSTFLRRYETPRPTLRTLSFLLFDHIGGINTMLHTLFNKGVVIAPDDRTIDGVLRACADHRVELLPTTPTFLRLMLMSGAIPEKVPRCLRIITYGTERMDQPTLSQLCELLPDVDLRQTYGMSELGILRAKSEARGSLFMKIGGEGVETKVVDGVLWIRSPSRMLGYLNAPDPFDTDGWYDTTDVVEQRGELLRITGRAGEVINVAGLKFMASEVERVALEHDGVSLAHARGVANPITGQHVEIIVDEVAPGVLDTRTLKAHMEACLPRHMVPRRVTIGTVKVGHRFQRE